MTTTLKMKCLTDDEDFVREFLATPYDNPMTADEAKQMIHESHHFEERNIKIENWRIDS